MVTSFPSSLDAYTCAMNVEASRSKLKIATGSLVSWPSSGFVTLTRHQTMTPLSRFSSSQGYRRFSIR